MTARSWPTTRPESPCPPQLRNAVAAVTELLPNATRQTLEGQGHGAPPEVLAPVLAEFFLVEPSNPVLRER
jgi:hypothetical protein